MRSKDPILENVRASHESRPALCVHHALKALPSGASLVVALSGGLDSTLLLTLAAALCREKTPLRALHVNHGMQPAAPVFEAHCRALCAALGVPLTVATAEVVVEKGGQGPEAAARVARYRALAAHTAAEEVLWLAQHADDQAETFLLAALRGSGVRGLAAMPAERRWQQRLFQRPLLALTRAELEEEARRLGLEWCEDPTNVDRHLDRNYLRHEVMAPLHRRWPQAAVMLSRSAGWLGEADALLEELAAEDLVRAGGDPGRLPLSALGALGASRRRLLIRHALSRLALPHPPAARLLELSRQLTAVACDSRGLIAWPGGEARLWRGALYLKMPQAPVARHWQAEWDGQAPLATPRGVLDYRLDREKSEAGSGEAAALIVTPRRGGERLRLEGRGTRAVKRLLQEAAVPPWERDGLFVVWYREQPVALLGALTLAAAGWRLTGPPGE